jgi:plastocyanin
MRRHLLVGLLLISSLVAVPSSLAQASAKRSARAVASHIDPILGDWTVTYGAPAVVTISGSSGSYSVTAKTPVRVTGSSCDLPKGTLIATFSGSGPSYSGQHGLWYTSNCSFAYWTSMSLTLNGNVLSGPLGGGSYIVVFTKVEVVKISADSACKSPASLCFKPAALKVASGTKVIFKNLTSTSHTVTRCDPAQCNGVSGGSGTDHAFGSGIITSGGKYTHVFRGKGTYLYFDLIDGYALLHGIVTVI